MTRVEPYPQNPQHLNILYPTKGAWSRGEDVPRVISRREYLESRRLPNTNILSNAVWSVGERIPCKVVSVCILSIVGFHVQEVF